MLEKVKARALGFILCAVIAVPATWAGMRLEVVGAPVFAILAGMLIALAWPADRRGGAVAGIAFTSKYVLQAAVVLLGFGMNLASILATGAQSLPIILSTITTALVSAYVLARLMHVPAKIATLVGVGSSICGGSAIAATAPVIEADDEEVAQAISVIFLFNVIAALAFPALGGMLGLSNEGFGLFAGTAVNDTSSVTAAAAAWDGMHAGANTLDAATIVKLTRTLAIIPITLVLSLWTARRRRLAGEEGASTFSLRRAVPAFVLLFVAASVVTTVLALPAGITAPLKFASKFFITMAMAAIGFNTDLVKLVRTGGKPIALGGICWVAIAAVSLGMQHVLGIW